MIIKTLGGGSIMTDKTKKIIVIKWLIIIFLMMLTPLAFSQIKGYQYNTFKLRDGTKLLIDKKTDEVEFVWDNKEQRWCFLIRYANGGMAPQRAIWQSRYNKEKLEQKTSP